MSVKIQSKQKRMLMFCSNNPLIKHKTAITTADILNDKVLPYFESQGLPMLHILTDRGSEY